jgi:hypothetical protein
VLLLALLPRVFIPAGYMPGAGSASGLRMCASGFPAALLAFSDAARLAAHAERMAQMAPAELAAHLAGMARSAAGGHAGHDAGHQDGHAAGASEHCVFATLAAACVLRAQQDSLAGAVPVRRLGVFAAALPAAGQRHFLPQARGPPALPAA